MDVSEKRELYGGFGDAMARAVEFAAAPLLFALAGRWLDGRFDTSPIFFIGLLLFAAAGLGARSYYAYKVRMESIDADSPWGGRTE